MILFLGNKLGLYAWNYADLNDSSHLPFSVLKFRILRQISERKLLGMGRRSIPIDLGIVFDDTPISSNCVFDDFETGR